VGPLGLMVKPVSPGHLDNQVPRVNPALMVKQDNRVQPGPLDNQAWRDRQDQ